MLLKTIIDYLENLLQRTDFGFPNNLIFQLCSQHELSVKPVKKVLITQNISLKTLVHAKKTKCNIIICNHGLPCSSLTNIDEQMQKFLLILLQYRIILVIIPESWHYIPEGSIGYLGQIIGFKFDNPLLDNHSKCFGMIYESTTGVSFEDLLSKFHRVLNLDYIQAIIRIKILKKILVSPFQHMNLKSVRTAKENQCDCIIASTITPDLLHIIHFYNMSYIYLPSQTIAEISMKRLSTFLSVEFPRIEFEYLPSFTELCTYIRKQNH